MSESKKVKLHDTWASSYSLRVRIALKMKGVECERVEEDFPKKSPELLRYNPVHKKVPVLVHGDRAIAESQVILEYIDETWDSGTFLLPRDPYERALARFWARFIDDKLLPSIWKWLWLAQEEARDDVFNYMKILDKEAEGKRFFGGENIGIVDLVAYFIGWGMDPLEEASGEIVLTEEAFPSLCKWRKEFISCDVVQQFLPPRDSLVSYYRRRIRSPKILTSPEEPSKNLVSIEELSKNLPSPEEPSKIHASTDDPSKILVFTDDGSVKVTI